MRTQNNRSRVQAQIDRARPPAGLRLYPQYVSPSEHDEIHERINADTPWARPDDHGNRAESYLQDVRPPPRWAFEIARRMVRDGIFATEPDLLQLTRYRVGGGQLPHIDQTNRVGPTVAAMALGSSRVVRFTRRGRRPVRLLLFPGDLYVMEGSARSRWEHEVPYVEVDTFQGQDYPRTEGIAAVWCQLTAR